MCTQLLSDMASLRYSMYAVFVAVPKGLVRRLATQKFRLTEDEEDEEEDDINPKLVVGALGVIVAFHSVFACWEHRAQGPWPVFVVEGAVRCG